MRCSANLLLSALLAAWNWNVRAAAADVNAEAQRFSQMYLAPMDGANFFRLYDPETGMVEFCRNWRSGGIDGAGGWHMAVETNGDFIVRGPSSRTSYTFRNGRPFSMVASDGKRLLMQFDEEPTLPGEIPPMWEGAEDEALESVVKKFTGYRLRLFYVNPNHAAMLLAELALLGLFAFLFGSKKAVIASGVVGFATAAFLLLKTDGRGAALGLALGTMLLLGFRFFRSGGKVRATVVSALAIVIVAVFFIGSGLGGRFTVKKFSRGVSTRLEMWPAVPRMMVESPYGWGNTSAGRAYGNWYQPLSSPMVTPSLDSDHLTYMTGFGWVGRFVWVFAWLALLFSLFRFAAGGGTPLPLAVFSAFGLAAMFNPLVHVWSLWIVPVASLWPFAVSRPCLRFGKYAVPLAAAAVIALCICIAFYLAGREPSRLAVPSIFADGKRVFVGSREPDIWVVDDGYSIGWLSAPKEIRYFYSAYAKAPPLGYVQELQDVPASVKRLVVAGRQCREYVKLWKMGKAPRAGELIFLSPGMPLAAVPAELRKSCKFAMVVGEFAVRYTNVYGRLDGLDEVVVTEGAETYLPGWVGLVLSM